MKKMTIELLYPEFNNLFGDLGNAEYLEKKLKAAGAGVTATLTGNRLTLTTDAKGSGTSVSMEYSKGGSSMEQIFGTSQVKEYGVEASFDSNNRLTLKAVDESGAQASSVQVRVESNYGSIFQQPREIGSTTSPGTAVSGYRASTYSYIDGASLNGEPVTIDRWNKDLTFYYNYNGSSQKISVTLDEGDYSYDQLRRALQDKLDAAAGAGALKAEVSADGVKIAAGKPGRDYYMSSFSGGFYYNVLRRTKEQSEKMEVSQKSGGYDATVYAVGRKDIRNNTTEITKGINDTLSLDFTYGTQVEKLEITLDAGKYSGDALVKHIQQKLNEQLKAHGLDENLIQAQIGGVRTGVAGNNDDNALVFKLAEHSRLPADDVEYRIDGLGGSAAFSVFYQTDGDMKIAYITGTKDISQGVSIPEDSDFSFDVDGNHYSVTIPAGDYTSEELISRMNELLKDAGAPATAKVQDGALQITHTKYGKHPFTNVSGSARRYLFFQEEGSQEGEKEIWIQTGSEAGDGVNIKKDRVNTVSLGLNSCTVTRDKYTMKTLQRVKGALAKVTAVRSDFGAEQNRLEHTIRKNQNTSENTQMAESRMRDADMAGEMMELAKENILQDVGASMLAQANQTRESMLMLLR